MIVGEQEHLQYTKEAAREVKQDIPNAPSFSALSSIIHVCLRDVFDESGAQFDVWEVIQIVKPLNGSQTRRNESHNHKESNKTNEHSSHIGNTLLASLAQQMLNSKNSTIHRMSISLSGCWLTSKMMHWKMVKRIAAMACRVKTTSLSKTGFTPLRCRFLYSSCTEQINLDNKMNPTYYARHIIPRPTNTTRSRSLTNKWRKQKLTFQTKCLSMWVLYVCHKGTSQDPCNGVKPAACQTEQSPRLQQQLI